MKKTLCIIATGFAVLGLAFRASLIAAPHTSNTQASQTQAAEEFTISGTMQHTDLEGGCWYLDASDGKHYELIGAPDIIEATHSVGKPVSLLVRPAKGRASICMVGPIVEIVRPQQEVRHPIDPAVEKIHIVGTMHKSASGNWYVRSKQGITYTFSHPVPKKYRKSGLRIDATWLTEIVPLGTKGSRSTIIEDLNKTQPKRKNIQKTYDAK